MKKTLLLWFAMFTAVIILICLYSVAVGVWWLVPLMVVGWGMVASDLRYYSPPLRYR